MQAPPSAADSDAQSSLLNSGCRLKFDRLRKADEIFVDDSLPPSSYIYSISVCPLSFMELEKFWLPRRSVNYSLVEDGAEKFFAIDSTTGWFLCLSFLFLHEVVYLTLFISFLNKFGIVILSISNSTSTKAFRNAADNVMV